MKIAIYFSEKLILFLFRPPPPPNPLPQGEGGLLIPFRKGVGSLDIYSPSPCGRGSGGGVMEIAIYFNEKLILFLFRLYNEE
jgi:hypothetical protein